MAPLRYRFITSVSIRLNPAYMWTHTHVKTHTHTEAPPCSCIALQVKSKLTPCQGHFSANHNACIYLSCFCSVCHKNLLYYPKMNGFPIIALLISMGKILCPQDYPLSQGFAARGAEPGPSLSTGICDINSSSWGVSHWDSRVLQTHWPVSHN